MIRYFKPQQRDKGGKMGEMTNQKLIQEGVNRVLYLLLAIGDENVAHDNYHPDKAQFLYEVRKDITRRLKLNAPHYPALGGNWPDKYPDFETYTYRPG